MFTLYYDKKKVRMLSYMTVRTLGKVLLNPGFHTLVYDASETQKILIWHYNSQTQDTKKTISLEYDTTFHTLATCKSKHFIIRESLGFKEELERILIKKPNSC